MEQQSSVLQKAIDELAKLGQPGSTLSSQEQNLHESLTKKIKTFLYLTHTELTLIGNGNDVAMYPQNFVPKSLISDRRHWLRQCHYFLKELEVPWMEINNNKLALRESKLFGAFVEDHEDIVFGKLPLELLEIDWSLVEL